MTHTFTTKFRIRQYELDSRNELPNSTLARLFQETAMRGSADAGFGVEWYSKNHSTWVIHQLTLEHLRAIHYRDEIAITTWVSDIRRVFSHREYVARNVATNEIVARGRANWLHLNPTTMMPMRVPVDIVWLFNPNGVSAVPRTEPRVYPAPRTSREFQMTRRVQRYEADGMKHVNNAIYFDWIEEAIAEAAHPSTLLHSAQDATPLRSAHPERNETDPLDARHLCVRRHDIEYLHGAVPGDKVEITARLVGAGQCAHAWQIEIARAGETLVRDRIVAVWRNADGRVVR